MPDAISLIRELRDRIKAANDRIVLERYPAVVDSGIAFTLLRCPKCRKNFGVGYIVNLDELLGRKESNQR